MALFFGRSILARKWPAQIKKNYVAWRIVAIRDRTALSQGWNRATHGTPRACCEHSDSALMRPLVLDGPRGTLSQLTFVQSVFLVSFHAGWNGK